MKLQNQAAIITGAGRNIRKGVEMKLSLGKSKLSILSCLIFLFAGLGYSQETEIAKYPTRPITFIIPYTAGVNTDVACRLISKEAEKYLGQPIVPVNKTPPATGTAAIATAKPDGYTIGFGGQTPLLLLPLLQNVPYHPIKNLEPIIQFASFNFGVIVKADSPFKSFQDVIAYAHQNPKKLTYASTANSIPYFIMDQIAKKENVQFTIIPFNSTADGQMALLGGHVLAAVGDFSYSLVEAGQVRLLMLLKEEHSAEYPGTPILRDLGYTFPSPMICSIIGPKGIPGGIVKKLEDAFTKAMKEPTFIKRMKEDLRLPIFYRNSKDMGDYVARNYEGYAKLLKEMMLIK